MEPSLLGITVLSALLVGFGILGSGFSLILLIARYEKQFVHMFIPLEEGEEPRLPAYAAAMNHAAQRLEYRLCGIRKHAKGGTYRAFGALWLNPSHASLTLVCWGKVGGMTLRKTDLYSRTGERRYVESSDGFSLPLPSDVSEMETLLNADLFELARFHEQRINVLPEGSCTFSPEDCWSQFDEMNAIVAQSLVQTGNAVFIDAEKDKWRYTMKGACVLAWRFVSGSRRSKQHKERITIRRPGEAGYVEWPGRIETPDVLPPT